MTDADRVVTIAGLARDTKLSQEDLRAAGLEPERFAAVFTDPDVNRWLSGRRTEFPPVLRWDPAWGALADGIVPASADRIRIGAHVSAETSAYYGYGKDWEPASWRALFACALGPPRVEWLLLGQTAEPRYDGPHVTDLRGRTGYLEMASILRHRCRLLVAPDSGVLATAYSGARFPLDVVSLWSDPRQGVLLQGCPSPNSLLRHVPLVGRGEDARHVPVDDVVAEPCAPRSRCSEATAAADRAVGRRRTATPASPDAGSDGIGSPLRRRTANTGIHALSRARTSASAAARSRSHHATIWPIASRFAARACAMRSFGSASAASLPRKQEQLLVDLSAGARSSEHDRDPVDPGPRADHVVREVDDGIGSAHVEHEDLAALALEPACGESSVHPPASDMKWLRVMSGCVTVAGPPRRSALRSTITLPTLPKTLPKQQHELGPPPWRLWQTIGRSLGCAPHVAFVELTPLSVDEYELFDLADHRARKHPRAVGVVEHHLPRVGLFHQRHVLVRAGVEATLGQLAQRAPRRPAPRA